jgi:hypothetical protein
VRSLLSQLNHLEKQGLFITRIKRYPERRHCLWVIVNVFDRLFPFENVALEINENCKRVGVHNRALNENLEGFTKLFVGGESISKLFFRPVDKAKWLRRTFVNKTDPFHSVFRPPVIQWSIRFSKVNEVPKIPLSPTANSLRRSSFQFNNLSIVLTIVPISLWFTLTQSLCYLRLSLRSLSVPRQTGEIMTRESESE